jgi:diguanylate cyclase
LIVWDIDHFKSINDRYGHKIGDQVIACVARKISQRLRQSDFIARFGGEEFVALLSDCDAASARELAEGLRKEIAGCMVDLERGCVRTTVSCGIAELAPEEDDARLFARADEALYRAKRGGRNRVCIAGS